MYIDQSTMLFIWLGVIIITLVIEIITQGLTTIWFSIGAAVAAIVNNWAPPLWVQIAVFCVVSIVFMLLARPFAQRMMRNTITPTNIDQLLQEEAIVIEPINSEKQTGRVRLRDVEWIAKSEDGSTISEGETVSIRRIDGVKLIVTKK